MKVAIVSDIHGNMFALKAVLADIQAERCEKILCLGDLAMAGPKPVETLEFIKQQDWTVIQGNTDELIAEFTPELGDTVKSQFEVMGYALEDDAKIIPDEYKKYLKDLPKEMNLTIEGVKVLMVHGSPRRNNENIMPDMPLAEIEEMLKGVDADLILCGHTHLPCGYQTNTKQTVVNVGSVGRSLLEDTRACYAVLDFEDGGFEVKHKLIDYDRELAAKTVIERGFQSADRLAEMLVKSMQQHI